MAVSFQNAARIAWNSRDEEGVDGDVDEQQQPPIYRPCDPHADGRPHRLQWGRPRQERARRPRRCREHASDSFAFRGGSSDGSPKRLCSPENGSTEAEDDGGDDETYADHATASETSSQRTELNLNLVVQISHFCQILRDKC